MAHRSLCVALAAFVLVTQSNANDEVSNWIIKPVVRLSSTNVIGSGVIIRREKTDTGRWRTTLLTAHHVLINMMTDLSPKVLTPFLVEVVNESGNVAETHPGRAYFESDMAMAFKGSRTRKVQTSFEFDLNLVSVESDEPFGSIARLPTLASMQSLGVGSSVHLVGFPLGIGPYHTLGTIGPSFPIANRKLKMITAPGVPGNSGGGVFRNDTAELIGIFSKVIHGENGPVPHMGLFVPIEDVYYWMYFAGLAHWVPQSVSQ